MTFYEDHLNRKEQQEYLPGLPKISFDDEETQKLKDELASRNNNANGVEFTTSNNLTTRFNEILKLVDNKFNKNRAVYTMYLKFMLNDQVLVDTASPEWTENCLISFDHDCNGSGQANSFTLKILFKPNDRNIQNIMAVESKLLVSTKVTNLDNYKDLKNIQDLIGNCSFVYGYGTDVNLRTEEYTGRVMKYTSDLDNGNLIYTITGYSGLYSNKETRLSTKAEYGEITNSDGSTTEISNPIAYIKNIIKIEYDGIYEVKILGNEDYSASEIVYSGGDYKQFTQKNIFQIIKDILAGCMTKEQYDLQESGKYVLPTQKQGFGFYVEDKPTETASQGTIYIYKLPSIQASDNSPEQELQSIVPDVNLFFNWFAPANVGANYLVKSWNPTYDGSVLIALAIKLQTKSYFDSLMNANGDVIEVPGLGGVKNGTFDDSTNTSNCLSTIQETDNWLFATQYPYEAKLTTMGIPSELPMTATMKIVAIMGGNQQHHSSGIYYCLGKRDTISSSGFFSEYKLFKMTPTYNPDWLDGSIKTDDKKEDTPQQDSNPTKTFGSVLPMSDAVKDSILANPLYIENPITKQLNDWHLKYNNNEVIGSYDSHKDDTIYYKDAFGNIKKG